MTRAALPALAAALLGAACTTNSAVETTETWTPPTEAQVAAFQEAARADDRVVNPYQIRRRAPQMKNGCATSVRQENGALVIPAFHPDEVYCLRLSPYSNTTLELPPGARLENATSAMMDYISMTASSTSERDVLLLTSKCVPLRKDETGAVRPADLHEIVPDLRHCPRATADLTVVMSSDIAQFHLILNESSHTARVDMREAEIAERPVPIPVRPAYAQTLHAWSVDGQEIPWTPDDAWADGDQTVIVWTRPMPTLPGFFLGENGEQRAVPQVVNHRGTIAMIWPQRATRFQLRIDDRILAFSEQARDIRFIRPAGS